MLAPRGDDSVLDRGRVISIAVPLGPELADILDRVDGRVGQRVRARTRR